MNEQQLHTRANELTKNMIESGKDDLDITRTTVLKTEIAEHHQKAQQHAEIAIEHAFRAGELLIEAKAHAGHGNWIDFLDGTGVNTRTAQRYMKLAKNQDRLKNDSVSHLSMTQSLELLSSKKKEPVKFDGGPPLIDFGISGLSENAQLNTILKDGSMVYITPSSKDPGFYFVEKFNMPDMSVEGIRRPVAEDAVRCCLDILGASRALWKMDKKTTDKPLFMVMSLDDGTKYDALEEMGIVPVDELIEAR